jgi:hypothetical protein
MHKIKMTLGALCAAAIGLALLSPALAQQPGRIRGTVEKVDGGMLVMKTRNGDMLNVKIAENARLAALVKATLADIKNDAFIGVAGIPQADGSIKAFSVHIFLPAQRGVVPDRHGPWDARPGSTMTNAYVESMVKATDGDAVMVKYKDGEKKILVTPETVIAAVAPGSKADIKPGAHVIIFASEKQADGSLLAKVMYVGRDVAPAM